MTPSISQPCPQHTFTIGLVGGEAPTFSFCLGLYLITAGSNPP